MAQNDLKLLDCTLRDGGYINNWKWGFNSARDIIKSLVKANVDIIEVGFLRNIDKYEAGVTVCNEIEELNRLLPNQKKGTLFSAMAMSSNYSVKKLKPYNGEGIEMIRITAHDYDIAEGLDFAKEVKKRGYKLSINPINIMGYSDEGVLQILDQVNTIHPYQFSIVDTFGSMKRRDLDRIVSLVDHNLDQSIRVALHLHENMSLSCCLAQNFIDKHLNRAVTVDGSLMGIGRIPGNLPIELIADYLNDYRDSIYDIDYMMDAIQDYIAPLKGDAEWGYTPAYFLSAKFNLHRNYAEYYLEKGDLTNRDINHILARFDRSKATAYDVEYADLMYDEYKNHIIDDSEDIIRLRMLLKNRKVLILAPGATIASYKQQIDDFIRINKPIIISVNFIPDIYKVNYGFFSNNKRFTKYDKINCKLIVTSNVSNASADFRINYNRLSCAFDQGFNSYIMLLKLLKDLNIDKVAVAGADGYFPDKNNYYNPEIQNISDHGVGYNAAVSKAVKNLEISIEYIAPSAYA